jgi:hypothetical protein
MFETHGYRITKGRGYFVLKFTVVGMEQEGRSVVLFLLACLGCRGQEVSFFALDSMQPSCQYLGISPLTIVWVAKSGRAGKLSPIL